MFRRKRSDSDDKDMPDLGDELGIPVKPAVRPASAVAAPRPPLPAARATGEQLSRAGDLPRRAGDTSAAPLMPPTLPGAAAGGASQQPRRDGDARKLIVGREISLSGEITSCDRLVVEGSVEANLANCRDIDIAESGLFKGSASIEDAEVRGRFEGTLTVRRRLLIRACGKVTGTVRYGQIEIECGGQISGDVQAQPMTEPAEAPEPRIPAPKPPDGKVGTHALPLPGGAS